MYLQHQAMLQSSKCFEGQPILLKQLHVCLWVDIHTQALLLGCIASTERHLQNPKPPCPSLPLKRKLADLDSTELHLHY